MPTTYIHANGVKIGHIKDGVRTDYLTDALGSVTATKNQSQQVINTYRYKPYGGLLAKTGAGDDPRYLWTGNTGSRVTNTRFANQYNVHRHYANGPAAWTTMDMLWPEEVAYQYCNSQPLDCIDPHGAFPNLLMPPRTITRPGPGQGRPRHNPWTQPRGRPSSSPRPKPGRPTPVMDPNDTIGWTIHGIVCTTDDIRTWLYPPPKPGANSPLPRLNRKWSLRECQDAHRKYKDICSGTSGCTRYDDCIAISNKYHGARNCAILRQEVIVNCDYRPPSGWTPNECGHMKALCLSMSSACTCIACGRHCGIGNTDDEKLCFEWLKTCKSYAQVCSPNASAREWFNLNFQNC